MLGTMKPVVFDPYGRRRSRWRPPRWLVLLAVGVAAGAAGVVIIQERFLVLLQPERITIDKSAANTAAAHGLVADSGLPIELRQSKYLNNLVEQDHRAVKRRIRPMLGFKTFESATKLIAGIETMHMIKKGQLGCHQGLVVSDADRFYSLAVR